VVPHDLLHLRLLPAQPLPAYQLLIPLYKASGTTNVFIDCASSIDYEEAAVDVSTCLAPTHSVFSTLLGRRLLPIEHLSLQGIWRCDAENLEAFDTMVANQSLAKSLAGNSFSATVAQCAFLASLITCPAWIDLGPNSPTKSIQPHHEEPSNSEGLGQELCKEVHDQSIVPETSHSKESEEHGDARCSHQVGCLVPTKRLRKKTTLVPISPKKNRNVGRVGNHQAKGKKPMVSITAKERIMRTYYEAVSRGDKKPTHAVKGLPGYFPGCVFESKWGRVRREQHWEIFVHTAPRICAKHKELPNCLRRILKMKTMKHSTESTQCTEQIHLPHALKTAVESMVMSRLELGEEVTMAYVQNTLEHGVKLWNTVVNSMQDSVPEKCLQMLKSRDSEFAELDGPELETRVNKMVETLQSVLKPINLKGNDDSILFPACKWWDRRCYTTR